eukprot:TRINITY_DN56648_c0_g1_i1.p1 TRINITY_DN56648_c0_g1~~TRINITY_DN56648_c0_g1_i1.p1  ORF type:complete len:536 (-),score=117.56 TRINITY_DN56648_c0_g1_i1:7-1614(-)
MATALAVRAVAGLLTAGDIEDVEALFSADIRDDVPKDGSQEIDDGARSIIDEEHSAELKLAAIERDRMESELRRELEEERAVAQRSEEARRLAEAVRQQLLHKQRYDADLVADLRRQLEQQWRRAAGLDAIVASLECRVEGGTDAEFQLFRNEAQELQEALGLERHRAEKQEVALQAERAETEALVDDLREQLMLQSKQVEEAQKMPRTSEDLQRSAMLARPDGYHASDAVIEHLKYRLDTQRQDEEYRSCAAVLRVCTEVCEPIAQDTQVPDVDSSHLVASLQRQLEIKDRELEEFKQWALMHGSGDLVSEPISAFASAINAQHAAGAALQIERSDLQAEMHRFQLQQSQRQDMWREPDGEAAFQAALRQARANTGEHLLQVGYSPPGCPSSGELRLLQLALLALRANAARSVGQLAERARLKASHRQRLVLAIQGHENRTALLVAALALRAWKNLRRNEASRIPNQVAPLLCNPQFVPPTAQAARELWAAQLEHHRREALAGPRVYRAVLLPPRAGAKPGTATAAMQCAAKVY